MSRTSLTHARDDLVHEVLNALSHETIKEDVDIYPATPLQSGMVAATIKDAKAYVSQMQWLLSKDFCIEKMQSAVDKLVNAHTIFATSFVSVSAGIYQVVDLNTRLMINLQEDEAGFLEKDLVRGFSVQDKHWMRLTVLQKSNVPYMLTLSIHHALYDGWCISRILKDLFDAYNGVDVLPSPPFKRVVEYIATRQKDKSSQKFWKDYLQDYDESSVLAPAVIEQQGAAGSVFVESCEDLTRIQRAASAAKVTIASVSKAAWALTLQKYTQNNDVIFGNVVSGRDIPLQDTDRYILQLTLELWE